ncbi:MAG TPA: MFS transporter [Acidobacteriaceae bacterium]|nr:MFS transporter [Acidobacteriaceae bacterium]
MATPQVPHRAAAAFASRDFRFYQMARLLVIVGAEAQAVAVAWQIYQITHRAIDLGYTGLALFLPGILFLLISGHTADRYDRRHIILVCYGLQCLCTGTLFYLAWCRTQHVWGLFAVLFLIGTGRAFSGPASSALLPHLVPKGDFVNAVSWGASIFQMANFVGPAIGGLLYTLPLQHWLPASVGAHLVGGAIVYGFTLACLVCFLLLVGSLSVRPGRQEQRAMSAETLLAGFRYMWHKKLLLGVTTLDLFAVLLGGAVTLLPIFAQDILHSGPRGLGMLRAAPAFGALTISMLLTWRPMRRQAGARMLFCVAVFGAATVVFGLSRNLALSLGALFLVGASDMVSIIVRSSMLQLATPQDMRGRVSAVNALFVGASNEFGGFESGVTAQWWGAVPAVVVGGIGAILVTGIWTVLFPSLRQVNRLSEEELRGGMQEAAAAEPA